MTQVFRKSHERLLAWTFATISCLFSVSLGTVLYAPIFRSQKLLDKVKVLKVGNSNFSDTDRLARELEMTRNADVPCSQNECLWDKSISNHLVPGFWKGHETTLSVGLRVESDRLVSMSYGFLAGDAGNYDGIIRHETIPSLWKMRGKTVNVAYRTDLDGHFRVSIINISPSASEAEKDKYLGFDLTCFARYHGCQDAFEFLPALREDPRLPRNKNQPEPVP